MNKIFNNRKHLFGMIALCGLIPHLVLWIIQTKANSGALSPVEAESYRLFITREWISFWAVYLNYRRLQKAETFSFGSIVCFGLILLTWIPRLDKAAMKALWLIVPVLLILESSTFLHKLEHCSYNVLRGIGENRGALRSFFFWLVIIPVLTHISCAWTNGIVVPLMLLPVPVCLLVSASSELKDIPPRLGAILVILLLMPITYGLVTTGPMEQFRIYHLIIFMSGYLLFFLLQGVYHADVWCRPRNSAEK